MRIQISGGGFNYGVLVEALLDQGPITTIWLRDGRIGSSFGGIGGAYAVSAAGSTVNIERVDLRTGGVGPTLMLEATRQSRINVQDSFL